jgi:hypothetical protein
MFPRRFSSSYLILGLFLFRFDPLKKIRIVASNGKARFALMQLFAIAQCDPVWLLIGLLRRRQIWARAQVAPVAARNGQKKTTLYARSTYTAQLSMTYEYGDSVIPGPSK